MGVGGVNTRYLKLAGRLIFLAIAMYVASTNTFSPRVVDNGVSLIYMPIALLCYLFYISRTFVEGLVYAGSFLVGVLSEFAYDGGTVLKLLPYLAVDILETGLLAIALRLTTTRSLYLRRPWRVTLFLGFVATVPMGTALIAAAYSTFSRGDTGLNASGYWAFWQDWYLGDVTAYLTVTAILLMARRFWWRRGLNTIRRRPVEFTLSILFLIGAVLYDFQVTPVVEAEVFGTHFSHDAPHPALLFMTFPAVVWLAFRFRQLGAAVGVLLTSIPTIHLVASGYGPFWVSEVGDRVVIMQAYIGISAIAAFYVGALAFQVRHREYLLKRAFSHAQRRARDSTDFLTAMNHEIRTPLNAIIGYSELMTSQVTDDLPDRYRAYAEAIDQSSKRLLHLVNEVMDLTRISSGSFTMEKERLNLNAETEEIVTMLAGVAERGTVEIVNTIPPQLAIPANRIGLRHALTNVISNALRHTLPGGSIRIAAQVRGAYMHLDIADTGEGFDVARVLDSKTLARGDNRAGFGLQITDTIMALHEGRMLVDSRIGKGTTVVLVFPLSEGETEDSLDDVAD